MEYPLFEMESVDLLVFHLRCASRCCYVVLHVYPNVRVLLLHTYSRVPIVSDQLVFIDVERVRQHTYTLADRTRTPQAFLDAFSK